MASNSWLIWLLVWIFWSMANKMLLITCCFSKSGIKIFIFLKVLAEIPDTVDPELLRTIDFCPIEIV